MTSQLELRAAPHLRSIGENAVHIVGCRACWFSNFLGEQAGRQMSIYMDWNEFVLQSGASLPAPAEIVEGLDYTWQFIEACLARCSPAEMQRTFADDRDGERVEISRARVISHVIEHDLHHGGELSLTPGMHAIPRVGPEVCRTCQVCPGASVLRKVSAGCSQRAGSSGIRSLP
jgi:uncharacterized damage-inducible protein DinB